MGFISFTFLENVEQHLGELWVLVEINKVRETIVHLQCSKLLQERKEWERRKKEREGIEQKGEGLGREG